MGSKKHKERDKKKRKRERSRSRSKERKHRRHHKHHKRHKRSQEEHSPSISLSDLSDVEGEFDVAKSSGGKAPFSPPKYGAPSPPSVDPNGEDKNGNEVSLSVEETNKLRAKLGLKPLEVKPEIRSVKNESEVGVDDVYRAGEEVHMPAVNPREKVEMEKLREKISAQKDKRKVAQKMSKVKTLGEAVDVEEDSAAAWVRKSRKVEEMKKEAEKRNKLLEDLDAQFGVGDLVDEEFTQVKRTMYDSRNLSGLKVEHDIERFDDGRSTILTLKDSSILDGEEDTLVNVNMVDKERVETNLKRKRAKPNHEVEYETPEMDEFGNVVLQQQNNLLSKYDEEIDGEKRQSFRLGVKPQHQEDAARKKSSQMMSKLRRQVMTLDTPESQLASEYLTAEEVSFKKVKKRGMKKGKKKNKMMSADDLEPLEDSEQHWGSRNSRTNEVEPRSRSLRLLMEEEDEEEPGGDGDTKEVQQPTPEDAVEGDSGESEKKEAIELREALSRSRRAAFRLREGGGGEKNAPSSSLVRSSPTDPDSDGAMTLNLTDEFCRTLGDIPTYGLSGNRADDETVLLTERTPKAVPESWERKGAWEEVDIDEAKVEIECEKSAPILEEEPDTGRGVVNALRLAIKKGYLQKDDSKKVGSGALHHLKAVHYSIEDKAVDDERRGGRGGGDRYLGPMMDFREKDSYKPDVKLDYIDDEGRKLCEKEAFRYLSHKFHGKGSGKNKLEKRMKKWQEERLMKHMSSSDTPLQTLERQREKQKQMGTAYLVLSGSVSQEGVVDVKK